MLSFLFIFWQGAEISCGGRTEKGKISNNEKGTETERGKYSSAQTRRELGAYTARVAECQVLVQIFKYLLLCIVKYV